MSCLALDVIYLIGYHLSKTSLHCSSDPGRQMSLVACWYLDIPHTLLALHVAAPVELALAPLCPPLAPGGVASVTAEQVTTIDTLGSLKKPNPYLLLIRFQSDLTGSHSLPCVPREPCSTSKSQYVGDSFKKTKSVSVWGLNLWNLGSSILRPRRFLCLTSWAMSNFFFKISPI